MGSDSARGKAVDVNVCGKPSCLCGDQGRIRKDSNLSENCCKHDAVDLVAHDCSDGNARDVFMTEVLSANLERVKIELAKLGIVDTTEDEDVICLGERCDGFEKSEKRLCFFGDGESLPIDVETDEYDSIPNDSPKQWYDRYCFRNDLTPECESLLDKAIDFYNNKFEQNAQDLLEPEEEGLDVLDDIEDFETVEPEAKPHANSVERYTSTVRNNVISVAEVEVVTSDCANVRRFSSRLAINNQNKGAASEMGSKDDQAMGESKALKRGRGRPPKKRKLLEENWTCERKSLKRSGCGVPTVGKRRRGRPSKEVQLVKTTEKRGRGRPCKHQALSVSAVKSDKYSLTRTRAAVLESTKSQSGQNSGKSLKNCTTFLAELNASQLCRGCCQKIGRKIGKDVEGGILRLEMDVKNDGIGGELVKRRRGRPKEACL